MSRLTSAAIILRTRPYGEADLIVDLFTEQRGRTTAVARGALRSKRRYMGILELGQIVKVDYVIKPGLPTLGPCDLIQGVRRVRDELRALSQLYYILELCLNCTPLEERDEALFQSMVELIAAIESDPGVDELALIAWELTLLSHLGYHLKIDRCPITGLAPDGLSFELGGAISSRSGLRHWPVKTDSLRILYRLQRGEALSEAMIQSLSDDALQELRCAFVGLWGEVTGKTMKTSQTFEKLSINKELDLSSKAFMGGTRAFIPSQTLQKTSALISLLLLSLTFIACQGYNERLPSTATFEIKSPRGVSEAPQNPSIPKSAQTEPVSRLSFSYSSLHQEVVIHCDIKSHKIAAAIKHEVKDKGLSLLSAQSKLWIETALPSALTKKMGASNGVGLADYLPQDDQGGLWVLYTAQNGRQQSLILAKPIPWLTDRAKLIGRCGHADIINALSFSALNTKRLIEPTRQLKLVHDSSIPSSESL